MRKLLQKLLTNPIIRFTDKYASRPDRARVHTALSSLFKHIQHGKSKKGLVLEFNGTSKLIIFSDHHKGSKDYRDDFLLSEKNYLAALDYYNQEEYTYCCLGDSEELWKNNIFSVIKHHKASFEKEKLFVKRDAFIKIYGNHDLYWDNDPFAFLTIEKVYGKKLKVYEGLVLRMFIDKKPLSFLLTHGHQGDLQSDGNWFSKWFVSNIWGPLQSYLRINPNTPANNRKLKSAHNTVMYEWTAKQKDLVLITGHTHQPVFNSLTHLERTYKRLHAARATGDITLANELEDELRAGKVSGEASTRYEDSKNTYFNAGCCCYNDGDITGIELDATCYQAHRMEV
ncbi:metallophosphoesterase [Olivibacter sp. SDN3]|uniref:metallophosphoesterase n=1 Tax=Olivibacter sp. SDN3 TaxID=2764720 RepID=UPI002107622D|nr:metallophosphoesterase [Olivibacter sp. SDN3]